MKKLLFLLALPLLAQTSVRVNVGGPLFVDSGGLTWAADTGCTGSNLYSTGNAISGTVDDTLYQTGRQDPSAVSCSYTVNTQSFYYVTLLFAETNASITTTNPRIFNIFINGVNVRPNTNILAISQQRNSAISLTFGPIAVFGVSMDIVLATVSGQPMLSALDITQVSTISGDFVINGDFDVNGGDIGAYDSPINSLVAGVAKVRIAAGGQALSSDSTITWKDATNLDAGGTYDTGISRCGVATLCVGSNASPGNANGNVAFKVILLTNNAGEPACSSSTRGYVVFVTGAGGVADTWRICTKDAADAYAYRTLF